MRPKKKRGGRTGGSRGIYLLPNLLTSASLFCGFFAVIAAIQGRLESAATAILLSCVFDALDGKVARFTRSTTHFGMEYDSLSDLVAFGVAPGILAYQWVLHGFGRLGWIASFMYVICGALRLARFNVQKSNHDPRYFRGLPIPGAAAFIAALLLFTEAFERSPRSAEGGMIIMMYVLSFLMVSTIEYPSFKELDLTGQKPFNVLVGIILVLLLIVYKPAILLFPALLCYLILGPVTMFYRLRKKRRTADPLADGLLAPERAGDVKK